MIVARLTQGLVHYWRETAVKERRGGREGRERDRERERERERERW